MNRIVWQTILQVLPSLVVVGGLAVAVKVRRVRQGRHPFKEPLVRGPGESLRLQLAHIDEKMIFTLVALVGIPSLVAIAFSLDEQAGGRLHQVDNPFLWFGWMVPPIGCTLYLLKLLRELGQYQLGYEGERYVGGLLNETLRNKEYVYRDMETGKVGNIDHVIVSRMGVFVVETKTRRKRTPKGGGEDYTIRYDGKQIVLADGRTGSGCVTQARRNAEWLQRFIAEAAAEKVRVTPILTFPGWRGPTRIKADVKLINPKTIPRFVRAGRIILSEAQVQRIAHQIKQACRVKE